MHDLGPLLYTAEWLAAHPTPATVIADVRWYLDGRSGRAAYEADHIPGAIFVDIDTDLSAKGRPASDGRHPLPDPHAFAATLARLGIGPNDVVVAYDDSGGGTAGRFVWMLRAIGRTAGLLDGGLNAWTADHETGENHRPAQSPAPAAPWPARQLATYGDVSDVPSRTETVLIDARAKDRYLGDVGLGDARAGHIPGAISLHWTRALDPSTGRFRAAEQLRDLFAEEGITAATDVIASCGSGVSACADLVALELAFGHPARLFVPSFSGWSSEAARTVETGPPQGP